MPKKQAEFKNKQAINDVKMNLIRVVIEKAKFINDGCSKLRRNVNCFGLTSD